MMALRLLFFVPIDRITAKAFKFTGLNKKPIETDFKKSWNGGLNLSSFETASSSQKLQGLPTSVLSLNCPSSNHLYPCPRSKVVLTLCVYSGRERIYIRDHPRPAGGTQELSKTLRAA